MSRLRIVPMNYRRMQITDYAAVMELWQACDGLLLREADSRAGIERYLRRNPGLSFVAETGERLIGTIMAGHDGRRGYIQHLAVAASARGQGVGGRLLELCLEALKSEGIEKSHVHVQTNNPAGRGYWIARGFTERDDTRLYSFVNGCNENA